MLSTVLFLNGTDWDGMNESEYNQEVITMNGKDCHVGDENVVDESGEW